MAARKFALAILTLGVLSACGGASGEGASGLDVPVPDQTVQQLMAGTVQPTAEVYWDSVRYINDETGNHDYIPETDEDWAETRAAAVKLSELGELLKTPAYSAVRDEAWMDFAQGLVDVGKMAEQTAIDRDVDAVFTVGGTVYNVCKGCHQTFPAEEIPEGVTEEEFYDDQQEAG